MAKKDKKNKKDATVETKTAVARRPRRKTLLNDEEFAAKVLERSAEKKNPLSPAQVDGCLKAVKHVIVQMLRNEKRVSRDIFDFMGICRFEVVDVKEKASRAPKTGGAAARGATRTLKIKVAKELQDSFNEKFGKEPSADLIKVVAAKNKEAGVKPKKDEKSEKGDKKKDKKNKKDGKKNKKDKE